MGLSPSPSTVPQSLGSLKPSVLTPPSPNEVTEFSESSRLPLTRVLATQDVGFSPPLSLPLQSTTVGPWQDAGCIPLAG